LKHAWRPGLPSGSSHGRPGTSVIRYLLRGRRVSSAGVTSAALHARENASMPPRERHGRLGLLGKAGISREKRSSGSHPCPKKNWCRSWRFFITAVSPASHSPATDQWPLATACVLWLRFRPAGPGTDDSTSSGNELCVDFGLASFCTFCGAGHSPCIGSPLPPDSLTTDHYSCATGHSDFTRHSPLATPSSVQ
jgi:hypothetical protein